MPTVVGNDGLEGAPSLQSICDLYRSIVNDTFNDGAGQINTDTAPWMKPFLNSAIRDLYSDLRIVSDMRVVRDNYILNGIPSIPVANPETQVAITYAGYYNGSVWNDNFLLPADLLWMQKVWQRPSSTQSVFYPVPIASSGLQGTYQSQTFCEYEIRGNNELWMNGATVNSDLRFRYMAVFPDLIGDNIDFSATYVPIQDCTNAVAHKMVANYAQRLSPDQFSLADSRAKEYTRKLITESVLNSQNKQYQRTPFLGQC